MIPRLNMIWWKHVILLLLVEGGAAANEGDIPDHQDIIRMQDKWKEYRNIVRGGFFFNDSVIVMADYSDDETDSDKDLVNIDESVPEISRGREDTKNVNDIQGDVKDSQDMLKVILFIRLPMSNGFYLFWILPCSHTWKIVL